MNQPHNVKYDILSQAFHRDPYPTLRAMREQDPIFEHPLLQARVLTRYADVNRVLRENTGVFSARKVALFGAGTPEHVADKLRVCNDFFRTWVAFLDPPEHTRLRALIAKAFTVQSIEGLRAKIESVAAELIGAARARGSLDVVAELAGPLPRRIFAELLGIPSEDTVELDRYSSMVIPLFSSGVIGADEVEAAHAGVLGFYAYFEGHIEARRSQSTTDLLSNLIEARVGEDRLSDDELVGMCVTLMIADHETTSSLISSGILTLCRQPRALQELRDNLDLIPSAVDEVMRYESPTFATFRRVVREFELADGVVLEPGSFVLAVLAAANRDPERFTDPDDFDIRRGNNRHLAFSTGIHVCPGAAMARLEGQIVLRTFVESFEHFELLDDTLVYVPHLMLRGPQSLRVGVR